jgi:hypothetical protein
VNVYVSPSSETSYPSATAGSGGYWPFGKSISDLPYWLKPEPDPFALIGSSVWMVAGDIIWRVPPPDPPLSVSSGVESPSIDEPSPSVGVESPSDMPSPLSVGVSSSSLAGLPEQPARTVTTPAPVAARNPRRVRSSDITRSFSPTGK